MGRAIRARRPEPGPPRAGRRRAGCIRRAGTAAPPAAGGQPPRRRGCGGPVPWAATRSSTGSRGLPVLAASARASANSRPSGPRSAAIWSMAPARGPPALRWRRAAARAGRKGSGARSATMAMATATGWPADAASRNRSISSGRERSRSRRCRRRRPSTREARTPTAAATATMATAPPSTTTVQANARAMAAGSSQRGRTMVGRTEAAPPDGVVGATERPLGARRREGPRRRSADAVPGGPNGTAETCRRGRATLRTASAASTASPSGDPMMLLTSPA